MIQHGRFLDAVPELGAREVVVLSDADVLVQRDFRPQELARFHAHGASTLSAGSNAGDRDMLADEAARLEIEPEEPDPYERFDLRRIPVYNCGVLVGRAGLFRRIQEEYERDCYDFYGRCSSRSRCQFHICLVLHVLGVLVDRLAGQVHTHGHFGLPPGADLRSEPWNLGGTFPDVPTRLYYRDQVVMFRHAL